MPLLQSHHLAVELHGKRRSLWHGKRLELSACVQSLVARGVGESADSKVVYFRELVGGRSEGLAVVVERAAADHRLGPVVVGRQVAHVLDLHLLGARTSRRAWSEDVRAVL